jgi:hypothetical protein
MTDKTAYFPQDLVDEIMPPDRPTPDAWIVDLDDGAPALDLRFSPDEANSNCRALKDGDHVIFVSRSDYGVWPLKLTAEGYTVDVPMPSEANTCCILGGFQAETLATSLEECVRLLREYVGDSFEPDDVFEVFYYAFDDGVPYRFDAAARHFDGMRS